MSSSRFGVLWRRGRAGWPSRYPIVQAPNPPLLIALAGWVIAAVDIDGTAGLGRLLAMLGIVVWAGEEVIAGVNLFRRALGATVLAWLVLGLLNAR